MKRLTLVAAVTVASVVSTPALIAQEPESALSAEAREPLSEDSVGQHGRPADGTGTRRPWWMLDRPENGPHEEEALELEPVPNRDEVYHRLMERIAQDGRSTERGGVPRRYQRELEERLDPRPGDAHHQEQTRRHRPGRDEEAEEARLLLPAQSLRRRLRDEHQLARSEVDLRQEYLRLVARRIENIPAEELQAAIISMMTEQILTDLESLGSLDPNGLMGLRSRLAAQLLTTNDVRRLRQVDDLLSLEQEIEQPAGP